LSIFLHRIFKNISTTLAHPWSPLLLGMSNV
jgi:hypothetical protein